MRNRLLIVMTAGALGLACSVAPGAAQGFCPEGRTSSGKCVKPELAQDMRTGTIAFAQPKLSMTNPPVMPYQDGLYYIPRDHHEISNLHGFPPVTNPAGETRTINIGTMTTPIYVDVFIGPRP